MKHKTLSLYIPCLDGGCEDAGRVDLAGYTLISDERLWDLEAAEQDALEQARLNGIGASREATLMARVAQLEKIEAAALNLIKVKGRHHSEIAYQRLVTALENLK